MRLIKLDKINRLITTKRLLIIAGALAVTALGLGVWQYWPAGTLIKRDYASEGRNYLKINNYREAAQALAAAVKSDPDNAELRRDLARAYYGAKEMDKAVAQYEELNRLNTTDTSLNNLANAYRDKGNITKAKEFYQAAIKLNPQYSTAYLNLVTLWNGERLYDQSITLLQDGIAKGAGNTLIYSLASTYIKKGDTKAAKALLNDWVAKNPTDAMAKKLLDEVK